MSWKSIGAILLVLACTTQADVTGYSRWANPDLNVVLSPDPLDDYDTEDLEGFSVYVAASLPEEQVEAALAIVQTQLVRLKRLVDPADLPDLQQVPIWFTVNAQQCGSSLAVYHQIGQEDWLRAHGRNEEMAGAVEFCGVDRFVKHWDRFPAYVIHELAHGFHDRFLPEGFDNSHIIDAWTRAKATGKYDYVMDYSGDYGEAHAKSNALEYLAHLSAKYLSTDDEYPFVRPELRQYDHDGYRIAQTAWHGSFVSEWLDCDLEGTVKAVGRDYRTWIRFRNATQEVRSVHWINFQGERSRLLKFELPPGEASNRISTSDLHPWIVLDAEQRCLGLFRSGWDDEVIDLE